MRISSGSLADGRVTLRVSSKRPSFSVRRTRIQHQVIFLFGSGILHVGYELRTGLSACAAEVGFERSRHDRSTVFAQKERASAPSRASRRLLRTLESRSSRTEWR